MLFGGYWENSLGEPYLLGDTWSLAFGAVTAAPVAASRARATLGSCAPNPARRVSVVAFSLAAEAHASLAVFDLAGRRMRTLREGVLPAGTQSASWSLTDESGARVAPGLYLVELRIGRERYAQKLIVLD